MIYHGNSLLQVIESDVICCSFVSNPQHAMEEYSYSHFRENIDPLSSTDWPTCFWSENLRSLPPINRMSVLPTVKVGFLSVCMCVCVCACVCVGASHVGAHAYVHVYVCNHISKVPDQNGVSQA